ncbi:hypothetical protein SAMN05216573_10768 [Bradyrhizobium sp. Rc3b]|uniref:hypothetical protein n=1 Tax=Bradyrhizobium sp. Rc3b TaxID=1855322 RepID=UPI0008F1FB21|nr:hypothetical protein [Bradyrhizobium sp. Rc3b]SFN02444.1 hypothetical protein SAMN05216573_10768 [Bradyrhizobium sp. Rc3b]
MAGPQLITEVGADISKFQRAMDDTTSLAKKATLAITKQTIQMSAGFLVSQGAAGAATLAFGRLLGAAAPVLLAITAIRDAFKLMSYATELAKAKIEEFNAVTAEANATGFSTDFFQRITKSGGEARDKIIDLTEALKQFNSASTDKLGGSTIQKRLDELQKVGNFPGGAIGGNDGEGKLRSVVALIDDAMQKGQRLAALDLTETAFGPKVAAALRADSGYLDDMLRRADAVNKTQLISDEDLGRAQDLQRRMDEAQKILADKWKPVQDDIAKLGMNYHESWVAITEDLAAAVGYATQLYTALGKVPDWFANRIGGASVWKSITDATTTPESRKAAEDYYGITKDPRDVQMAPATDKLGAALKNYAAVTQAMRQAQDIATSVRGDTSKDPAKKVDEQADAYDRATEAIEKHIARLQADAQAEGLGAAAQAQMRAEATLTTAAMQAYGKVTPQVAAQISDYAKRTGEAATALEKARVAASIEFGAKTAFLTSEDVSIARQLAGVYGNDVTAALGSSEAAAMRMVNALTDISKTAQDINRGIFTDFTQQIRNGASAMDALKTAGLNALTKISDKLAQMAADQLWSSAFGGGGSGGFNIGSLFGGGGVGNYGQVANATGLGAGTGGLPFPMFAAGTNSAPGGLSIVGEKGPELVNIPRGAQVIPNDVLRSGVGGGGITVHAGSVNIQGDASEKTVALIRAAMAQQNAELPSRVVDAVRRAKSGRVL